MTIISYFILFYFYVYIFFLIDFKYSFSLFLFCLIKSPTRDKCCELALATNTVMHTSDNCSRYLCLCICPYSKINNTIQYIYIYIWVIVRNVTQLLQLMLAPHSRIIGQIFGSRFKAGLNQLFAQIILYYDRFTDIILLLSNESESS